MALPNAVQRNRCKVSPSLFFLLAIAWLCTVFPIENLVLSEPPCRSNHNITLPNPQVERNLSNVFLSASFIGIYIRVSMNKDFFTHTHKHTLVNLLFLYTFYLVCQGNKMLIIVRNWLCIHLYILAWKLRAPILFRI